MYDLLLDIFGKLQTFIVGMLGFAGVIYTIRMNARLSREQHERRIKHERTALRTALCSELEVMRRIFTDRSQTVAEDEGKHSVFIPEYIPNHVYSQLLDRIGLLTAPEIESVMDAYILAGELPTRLMLLTTDHDKSFDRPGYIFIDSEYVPTATAMHKSFLPKIEAALMTIRTNLERE